MKEVSAFRRQFEESIFGDYQAERLTMEFHRGVHGYAEILRDPGDEVPEDFITLWGLTEKQRRNTSELLISLPAQGRHLFDVIKQLQCKIRKLTREKNLH